MDKHYTVRQTADKTGVKPYVLRYWEEELDLHIGRNELGHRYYTGYDIQLFLNIKELKSRGLQLRAIKELIPQMSRSIREAVQDESLLLPCSQRETEEETARQEENVPWAYPGISREKLQEFQMILERLIAREMMMKNEDEKRCRSLDFAIRRQQMARREAAAAAVAGRKRA